MHPNSVVLINPTQKFHSLMFLCAQLWYWVTIMIHFPFFICLRKQWIRRGRFTKIETCLNQLIIFDCRACSSYRVLYSNTLWRISVLIKQFCHHILQSPMKIRCSTTDNFVHRRSSVVLIQNCAAILILWLKLKFDQWSMSRFRADATYVWNWWSVIEPSACLGKLGEKWRN